MQVTRHDSRRVTPFGHPGITARLTAPPGLSRPPTSFIGPWYQGIHRPPLPTYPTHTNHNTQTYTQTTNTKMLASTMQISTHHQPTTRQPSTRTTNRPCLAPRQQPRTHRVVLSEPQQGAHRCARRRHRTVPTTPRVAVLGTPAATRQNWPVSPPTSYPDPTERGRGLLSRPPRGRDGRSLERR
jgi:hypothetical protein